VSTQLPRSHFAAYLSADSKNAHFTFPHGSQSICLHVVPSRHVSQARLVACGVDAQHSQQSSRVVIVS
jgi:hypothetical protein